MGRERPKSLIQEKIAFSHLALLGGCTDCYRSFLCKAILGQRLIGIFLSWMDSFQVCLGDHFYSSQLERKGALNCRCGIFFWARARSVPSVYIHWLWFGYMATSNNSRGNVPREAKIYVLASSWHCVLPQLKKGVVFLTWNNGRFKLASSCFPLFFKVITCVTFIIRKNQHIIFKNVIQVFGT